MGQNTKIEWCDATVNFWMGCTKVSPACDFCYAETMSKRSGRNVWGKGVPRYKCKGAVDLAIRLQRRAEREGRLKVFTNSMSDFFDTEVPDEWREEAVRTIEATPMLDWLVLTKRHKPAQDYLNRIKVRHHLCEGLGCNYCGDFDGWIPFRSYPLPNLWLGVSIENRQLGEARSWYLANTPAAVRFWSVEPLLEDLGNLMPLCLFDTAANGQKAVDWVIVGGESGPHARQMQPDWARSIRDQCQNAGVAFFMKQMTRKAPIPDDLMVREFPNEDRYARWRGE